MGASSGPGSRPTGRASKAVSPVPASIPSASRRRTFKPFANAPRDGTPFNVAYIARYNPFAKTFELAFKNQYSGEITWEAHPRVWEHRFYCDLLPRSFELPKSFAMTFVARPAKRKTWSAQLFDRLFRWLRVPDTTTLMNYCWKAIAMEARQGRDGETWLDPKDDSAARKGSPK